MISYFKQNNKMLPGLKMPMCKIDTKKKENKVEGKDDFVARREIATFNAWIMLEWQSYTKKVTNFSDIWKYGLL